MIASTYIPIAGTYIRKWFYLSVFFIKLPLLSEIGQILYELFVMLDEGLDIKEDLLKASNQLIKINDWDTWVISHFLDMKHKFCWITSLQLQAV